MFRKMLTMVLTVMLLLSLSVTAYAQTIDPEHWGSISVTLKTQNEPVVGAELNVYYVAYASAQSDNTQFYSYTEPFEDCGVSLEDPELAKKLSIYVENSTIPTETYITDAKGEAVCDDLPHGLYLIKQTNVLEGFSTCTPFLVTLPMVTDSEIIYDVDATPKTEIARLTDITINKIWLSDAPGSVRTSVTIQLLRDDEVVETAVLNDANNWKITYEDMPASDAYSVKEIDAPKGYMPLYSKDGYNFTVYNMSVLIQTGQLIWPIPVLAAAGLLLLVVGVIILRKPGRGNA